MAMGIMTFAVIAIFLRSGKDPSDGILHFVALGVAAAATAASFIVPAIHSKNAAAIASDPKKHQSTHEQVASLAGVFQVKTIITCAIIEGAAFFNLVAYYVEGHKVSLFTGAAFIALILVQVPTQHRITSWIGNALRGSRDSGNQDSGFN